MTIYKHILISLEHLKNVFIWALIGPETAVSYQQHSINAIAITSIFMQAFCVMQILIHILPAVK